MVFAIRYELLFIFLLLVASCQPCTSLEAQICADLGPDCAIWKKYQLFDSLVPDSYLKKRNLRNVIRQINQMGDGPKDKRMCRLYSASHNYKEYTLPRVKYIVEMRKNPSKHVAPPSLTHPKTTRELILDNGLYFVAPGLIFVVAIYGVLAFVRSRRRGAKSDT